MIRACLLVQGLKNRQDSEANTPDSLTIWLCWSGELSFACLAASTPLFVMVAAPHDQENGSSASLQLPKASYFVILTQRGPLHLYPPNLFRYVSNLLYQNELSGINFQNQSH